MAKINTLKAGDKFRFRGELFQVLAIPADIQGMEPTIKAISLKSGEHYFITPRTEVEPV